MKVIEFIRTDDDQWRYEIHLRRFHCFKKFLEYTHKQQKLSKMDNLHRNYYKLSKNDYTLTKILYIHKGIYYTL